MEYENNINSDIGTQFKNELIEIIKKEQIDIEYSYEFSFNNTAGFQFRFNNDGSFDKKTIILPKFTDDDDLEQAIKIAHELGHYYVYQKSSKFKNNVLVDKNLFIKYFNERTAWKEAEKLMRHLGYWKNSFIVTTFKNKKKDGLTTYKPRYSWWGFFVHNAMNLISVVLKILAFSYLSVGMLLFFGLNEIPIPFSPTDPSFYEITRTEFFNNVQNLFWFLFITYILFRVFRKVFSFLRQI